ncbi:hypothetical protein C8Q80DRAFT_918187 [Daedaleopsis nitida]|nr:hypothetical protein C8Q80DRAFT_918187 [Daedaleopsis nitida]
MVKVTPPSSLLPPHPPLSQPPPQLPPSLCYRMLMMPYDACHHALQINEVFVVIVIALDTRTISGRCACAQLALVCREYHKIASPLLWRYLPNLLPVWNLILPENVPRSKDDGGYYVTTVLIERPRRYEIPAFWERIMGFTRRVFEVNNVNSLTCDADLIYALVAHNHGSFLPSLKRLQFQQTVIGGSTLEFLASETVIELDIAFERDITLGYQAPFDELSPDRQLVAPLLPSNFPFRFPVAINRATRSLMTEFVITAAAKFKNIGTLRIPSRVHPVKVEQLRPLAAQLEVLECTLDVACGSDMSTLALPLLRVLRCCTNYVDLLSFVSNTVAPKLQIVDLVDGNHCSPLISIIRRLVAAMCSPSFSGSLRSISFCAYALDEEGGDEDVGAVDEILEPCRDVSALESLSFVYAISRRTSLSCTDHNILTLTQTLPNLKFLRILIPAVSGSQSISALAFVHIAEQCPMVEEVHLSVDVFSVAGELPTLPTSLAPRHPLKTLVILVKALEGNIDSVPGVARLVNRLFPQLDVAASRSPCEYRTRREVDPWSPVWDQLEAVQGD